MARLYITPLVQRADGTWTSEYIGPAWHVRRNQAVVGTEPSGANRGIHRRGWAFCRIESEQKEFQVNGGVWWSFAQLQAWEASATQEEIDNADIQSRSLGENWSLVDGDNNPIKFRLDNILENNLTNQLKNQLAARGIATRAETDALNPQTVRELCDYLVGVQYPGQGLADVFPDFAPQ